MMQIAVIRVEIVILSHKKLSIPIQMEDRNRELYVKVLGHDVKVLGLYAKVLRHDLKVIIGGHCGVWR